MGPGLSAREGVLYVATNDALFVDHAAVSARSVRRAAPTLERRLLTNLPVAPGGDSTKSCRSSSGDGHLDKTRYLRELPFEKTLFLDADTYVGGGLEQIFELLERFDVAAAHAPNRSPVDVGLPVSFPELNTGVLAIRRNRRTRRLLARWHQLHLGETGVLRPRPAVVQARGLGVRCLARGAPTGVQLPLRDGGRLQPPDRRAPRFCVRRGLRPRARDHERPGRGRRLAARLQRRIAVRPHEDPLVLADLGAVAGRQPSSSR